MGILPVDPRTTILAGLQEAISPFFRKASILRRETGWRPVKPRFHAVIVLSVNRKGKPDGIRN